jgi:multiple sugar transport system permease protein
VVTDPVARWSLVVTAILSISCVALEFLLGLALALALVKNFRGRGIIMSLVIIPLFISPVIVGQAWALLLQRPFGPTNFILSHIIGREVTIGWLTEAPWNFIALILADVWQWTPFMFVILLAGLTAIPPNLYEAAELDGVGGWRAFWWITLPQLASMILLALTFRTLDAIRLFDTIYIMTGGGPGTNTYSTSFYLYTLGFTQFHLSEATAGAWILLILTTFLITFLVRRLLKAEPA